VERTVARIASAPHAREVADTTAPVSGISSHTRRYVEGKTADLPDSASVAQRPSEPRLSDAALVERIQSGDRSAFAELVTRHRDRLLRLATHMLKSRLEAEDVTQETFIRAFRAIDRFDGRSEPYTWLYRILINLSLNVIRARRSARVSTSSEDARMEAFIDNAVDAQSPESSLHDKRLYEALASGIDSLSDTLRCTLLLVSIDGRSHEDAAAILGVPEGTIAWRVHEARKKLRAHLLLLGVTPTGAEVET